MSKSKKQSFSIKSRGKLEQKLNTSTRKIGNAFFKSLKSFFDKQEKETSKTSTNNLETLIKSYENQNAAIAAASAAIPGPMGFATMTTEVSKVMHNQVQMIYDIGCSFGKNDFINKDVLLEIPLHTFGMESDFVKNPKITNGKLIESKQKEIKEKSQQLAKVMLENTLKKSVVRSMPLIGPAVMSYYAKKDTRKISETAIKFFSPQVQKN